MGINTIELSTWLWTATPWKPGPISLLVPWDSSGTKGPPCVLDIERPVHSTIRYYQTEHWPKSSKVPLFLWDFTQFTPDKTSIPISVTQWRGFDSKMDRSRWSREAYMSPIELVGLNGELCEAKLSSSGGGKTSNSLMFGQFSQFSFCSRIGWRGRIQVQSPTLCVHGFHFAFCCSATRWAKSLASASTFHWR